MKSLLTFALVAFSLWATAQTSGDCSTCTKPHGVQVVTDGTDLGVGWSNNWQFTSSGECTKGVSILINGVEHFPTADSLLHGSYVSSIVFPGLGAGSVCVVVRNYCSNPYKANPTNYVDSDPVCVVAPSAQSATAVSCKCANGKYYVTSGSVGKCINKLKCLDAINNGWTSSCNCQ